MGWGGEGGAQGITSQGGGEREGGARRRGLAPSLHVAAAAAEELGAGRGWWLPRQRVAGQIAQYSLRGRGRGWGRVPDK